MIHVPFSAIPRAEEASRVNKTLAVVGGVGDHGPRLPLDGEPVDEGADPEEVVAEDELEGGDVQVEDVC